MQSSNLPPADLDYTQKAKELKQKLLEQERFIHIEDLLELNEASELNNNTEIK